MSEELALTAAVVARARARIADPARWTTGAYARDTRKKIVAANGPTACRWCAEGAIAVELGAPALPFPVAWRIWELLDGHRLSRANDLPDGHASVLRGLEQLQYALESEEERR